MWRFTLVLLLVLSLGLTGCEGFVFIGGAFVPTAQTITGTVSIVQLTAVFDHGTNITVTAVTLLDTGDAISMNFCGDQRSQFPMNQFVKANFNPGSPCSTLVLVIVV